MALSSITSTSSSTATLPSIPSSVIAKLSGADKKKTQLSASATSSERQQSTSAKNAKRDPWKGRGRRLRGPSPSSISSGSSQTSNSPLPIQIKSPQASQDASSDSAAPVSEWTASATSSERQQSTSAKNAKRDPLKGRGRRLGGPSPGSISSGSSKTSNSPLPIQIKSPQASQDASSDSAAPVSEWTAARPESSGPVIREHFRRGADVLRQLAEEKYRLSKASNTKTELDSNLETLQKQENFSQAQISDAATLYKLSQESEGFGGQLKRIMKAGRQSKVDSYHQTIEDKETFSAILNGRRKAYRNSGLQPREMETVTDIMWRNPAPVLTLFGKLTTKPQDSTEERSNGSQKRTVQERLAPYTREGYHIGSGGYDEEAAQIRAEIRADLSRPSSPTTTNPKDLQSLSGYALVRGLAEIGTTLSQNNDLDIQDLYAWGNAANSAYKQMQAAHRKSNKMNKDDVLSSKVESELQHEATEYMVAYLISHDGFRKWNPDRIPGDLESLLSMWTVSDKDALMMALRSIPRGLPSRSELEKEKFEKLDQTLKSKLDDPNARWAGKR